MHAISCIVLAAVVTVTVGASLNRPYYNLDDSRALFAKYVKDYNKSYKDEADREVHYEAFVKNLKLINQLNALNTTAVYGINKFTDYTDEEWKRMLGYVSQNNN